MNTLWYVDTPGVMRLGDTNIEIHLLSEWTNNRFEVRWNNRVVERSWTLDMAKLSAEKWFRDLKEMGFYRG
jgi:hypothetical protein